MLPSLGISMIQLGVIVVTNLAIGMLTPPMGICLIVSGSISGDSLAAVGKIDALKKIGKKCYEYFYDQNEPRSDCGALRALKTKAMDVGEQILVKEGNRPIQITLV